MWGFELLLEKLAMLPKLALKKIAHVAFFFAPYNF
jgi:hypothetical protein